MRLLLILLFSLPFGAGHCLVAADTVVVVVRHAEKASDDPRDPNLSEVGQVRAHSLAKALADFPLTSAMVSEFRRTFQTANPTLLDHKVSAKVLPIQKEPVELYARRLAELVKRDYQGEAILIVSHSNTVPAVVSALTGIQVPPIVELSEFNRMYVITLPAEGKPRVVAATF